MLAQKVVSEMNSSEFIDNLKDHATRYLWKATAGMIKIVWSMQWGRGLNFQLTWLFDLALCFHMGFPGG